MKIVNQTLSTLLRAIIQKKLKKLGRMFAIEFAYNRSVHAITNHSPFEVMHRFNLLTHMDLLSLPLEETNLDDKQKTDFVKA